MQVEEILALTVAGIALGVMEGIRPGPLLTMVIRETLTGGWPAGARAASAPIFTDGPLIVVSVLLSGWVAEQPTLLFLISTLGAGFLVWFGVDCFRIEPPDLELEQADVTGSFRRGVITNLFNPNVYVFWFLIGGPLMASKAAVEPLAPVAYALSFLFSIIIVKMTIALFFDRTREALSPRAYRGALGICGLGMFGFAAVFLYQAYGLLPDAF
ncbi:MAG: LysE family transporter [Candidatus Thalassarchaeaceae archaeon]|nr:LysE family transporter [Candidatus Thalassarchaeaceae archaeon]MEE2629875.1 LysE family transporter [Candidatus Thermoplasmatota archaeon]